MNYLKWRFLEIIRNRVTKISTHSTSLTVQVTLITGHDKFMKLKSNYWSIVCLAEHTSSGILAKQSVKLPYMGNQVKCDSLLIN